MRKEETSLKIMERAAVLLAEANTIQEIKEFKALALTAADWAKRKGLGKEAEQHCQSYARRAEVKIGEMVKAAQEAGVLAKRGHPKKSTRTQHLAGAGITRNESAQAQMLASLPTEEREAFIAGKITATQVRRKKREEKRTLRRAHNTALVRSTTTNPLEVGAKFSTILLDPPWDWGDEGDVNQLGRATPDYATMSFDQLIKEPVTIWADVDAHLYLWITNRSLPKGFLLLDAWGFRYITMLTWPKKTFGMGNYFRGQTEHLLFGVRGSQALKRKNAGTLLPPWDRGPLGHSSKPSEIYDFIESCSPGPYLEKFSRQKRLGWTTVGADLR